MRAYRRIGVVGVMVLGCNPPLTREEAREALQEVETATQASTLASGSVEITTDFTIGDAVERAAEEIQRFYESQLPCADVSLEGATLTVEYGVRGECVFRGSRYSGAHVVSVARNDMSEVVVEHQWLSLSNRDIEVSGTATVTWNFGDPSRHVVHELEWTRFSDGRTAAGSGDRVQRPHEDGLLVGLRIDGERAWEGSSGRWDLGIDDVRLRWGDPVPYSGAYHLDTPFDKALNVRFEQLEPGRIGVKLKSGQREFAFDVVSPASAGD